MRTTFNEGEILPGHKASTWTPPPEWGAPILRVRMSHLVESVTFRNGETIRRFMVPVHNEQAAFTGWDNDDPQS